jgi:hypothetical protein
MKDDESFSKLMKQALEYEGENLLTPNEIKAQLTDFVGQKNAEILYNDMRVLFNPSKIKPTKSQYSLPPYVIDDLVVSTTDSGLQKTIKSYLTDVDMDRIFKEASDVAEKGTVPADFFKTEFEKIRSKNPKFWTELKRGEFMNIVKYLWSKGSTIWTKIPNKLKYIMLALIALGIAGDWVSEKYSEGADPAFEVGLKQCLIDKGYDSKEKIQAAKKDNIQKYNADLAACKTAVRSGAYGKGLENVLSYVPDTGTSSDDEIDVESLFDSKPTTNPQTQTTDTYENTLEGFKKWVSAQKLQGTPTEDSTIGGFLINGVNYQSSNVFTGLFAGTYTVYTKDYDGTIVTQSVTLSNQQVVQTYTVTLTPTTTTVLNGNAQITKTYKYRIEVTPPLPSNNSISFNIPISVLLTGTTLNTTPSVPTTQINSISFQTFGTSNVTGPTSLPATTTSNALPQPCDRITQYTSASTQTYLGSITGNSYIEGTIVQSITTPSIVYKTCRLYGNLKDTINLTNARLSNVDCSNLNSQITPISFETSLVGLVVES